MGKVNWSLSQNSNLTQTHSPKLTYLAKKQNKGRIHNFFGLGALCPRPGAGCPSVILWLSNLCIIL